MLLFLQLFQLQLLVTLEMLNCPTAVLKVEQMGSFLSTWVPCASGDYSLNSCPTALVLYGNFPFFADRLKQAVSGPAVFFLSSSSADTEK